MRKIYLLWVLCAYVLAGCSGGHDHDHEGHDHEHDGHDHGKEAATTAAHSNEIIFKEELAKAVGLQTKVVEPAPFTDVIKTSGSILAAQGDETTVVATVPGIVTFGNLSFVDAAAVRFRMVT